MVDGQKKLIRPNQIQKCICLSTTKSGGLFLLYQRLRHTGQVLKLKMDIDLLRSSYAAMAEQLRYFVNANIFFHKFCGEKMPKAMRAKSLDISSLTKAFT